MTLHRFALPAALCLLLLGPAYAEEKGIVTAPTTVAEDYCTNFTKGAEEARVARQTEDLARMREELDRKLKQVKEQTELLRQWVEQRKALQDMATRDVTKIYGGIDPEAAAPQLSKLEAQMAASIIRKLNPKRAADILSAMDATKAATIINLIAQDMPQQENKS